MDQLTGWPDRSPTGPPAVTQGADLIDDDYAISSDAS
jgi:hypothetical protein